MRLTKKSTAVNHPAGGYHPKKPSGWGMLLGIFITAALVMAGLLWSNEYISANTRYFDPQIQELVKEGYAPDCICLSCEIMRFGNMENLFNAD